MNTLSRALPGWRWMPPLVRAAPYWRTVGRFALWGPLVGGAPYAVFVITIPFAYAIGLVPALVAGMLFSAWLHAPAPRYPSAGWRAALGALCGALGCAAVAFALDARDARTAWAVLALHGVPAGALLGAMQRERRRLPPP